MRASTKSSAKPIKRLSTTLPDSLAHYVAEVTGAHGLYETPTEFIRDLIRRHMEQREQTESAAINAALASSMEHGHYSSWTEKDMHALRDLANNSS